MLSPFREIAETGSRPLDDQQVRRQVAVPRSTPAAVLTEVLAMLAGARVARGD